MPIGLIAGGGDLPRMIANSCLNNHQSLFIAGIEGAGVDGTLPQLKLFSIAKAGAIIRYFKENNVDTLLICGSLKRPNFRTLIPDAKGLAIISKIILKSLGDDALLKIIRGELESEGFKIIAVQDIIPELLAPHGSLSSIKPDQIDMMTIRLGWDAARYHGKKDLGQSVVVQNDTVLGLEDEKGTDSLLKKCAAIKQQEGCKPLLIKLSKPQQDMALDAPTIGVHTIENLATLGYGGLVIEARRTLIVNSVNVFAACAQHGLFLESYTDEDIHHCG